METTTEYLKRKYFKPRSLTWWMGALPLFAGSIRITLPFHGMADLDESIRIATSDADPMALVWTGLTAIGFRGAVK